MTRLRALTRKHPQLMLLLAAVALAMKAMVPAGFMLSASDGGFLTVTICSDASGMPKQVQIALPDNHAKSGDDSQGANKGQSCAFSGLGHAALGAADPVLLAGALAFILLLGRVPLRTPPARDTAFLRPPLRGPPVPA